MIQTDSLFNPTINGKTKHCTKRTHHAWIKQLLMYKVRERKKLILFVFLHVSQGFHMQYMCMQNVKYNKYVKHTQWLGLRLENSLNKQCRTKTMEQFASLRLLFCTLV